MNNKPFGKNRLLNMVAPLRSADAPPVVMNNPHGIMRCGADQLKIKPRPIDIQPIQKGSNNNIPLSQQQSQNYYSNVNINNNNIGYNFNNANPNVNNHPNIPPQWRDFY